MKIYKHKKTGKLYFLHVIDKELGKKKFIALPFKHDGKPINNCDTNDFVPHSE